MTKMISSSTVISSGVASALDVTNGATVTVFGGATVKTALVEGGASLVFSGAVPGAGSKITVSSGTLVDAGATLTGITLGAGALDIVSSGGVESRVIVSSGATVSVTSGGVVSGLALQSGGALALAAGAVVRVMTLSAGASLTVASGVDITGLKVLSGATLHVQSGGFVQDITPQGGAILQIDALLSGMSLGHEVVSGFFQDIQSGATVSTVSAVGNGSYNSGHLQVEGTVGRITVGSGGIVDVYQNGVIDTAKVGSSGTLDVGNYGRGTLQSGIVSSGGELTLGDQGYAYSVIVAGGGAVTVAGGTVQNLTVSSGGVAILRDGAKAGSLVLKKGATLEVFNETLANITSLTSAKGAVVVNGLVSSGQTVSSLALSSVMYGQVNDGGHLVSASVTGSAQLQNYGTIDSAAIGAGSIGNRGSIGALVLSGGEVGNNATVTSVTITSSGAFDNAGVVDSVVLGSGIGGASTESGGVTSSVTLHGGAYETYGGITVTDFTSSGGYSYIPHGVVSSLFVYSGGAAFEDANGAITSATVYAGAGKPAWYLDGLSLYGSADTTVTMVGSGVSITLGNPAAHITLSGFAAGDLLHLTRFTNDGASAGYDGGTLTLSNGAGQTTSIVVGGGYVADKFHLTAEGQNTLITYS